MKAKTKTIVVDADTEGFITGRNGTFDITKVVLTQTHSGSLEVLIDGVGKRGKFLNGGLRVTVAAMDELCEKWLKERGKLKMSDSDRQTIQECARATRAHVETIQGFSDANPVNRDEEALTDVVEGMCITATKLEVVLRGDNRKPQGKAA
jgi:hypothetical protein